MEQTDEQNLIKEMQGRILGILTALDKVCKEHHLRYYLIAGTMLGAVRHKGFIPWDDDADIALPRKDYDELVKHANEWLPEPFEMVSEAQNPYYPYPFVRVQDKSTTYILRRNFDFVGGVPVDVFPLDGMTDNRFLLRWHYMKYNVVKKMLYFSTVDPLKHGHGYHFLFYSFCRSVISPVWAHKLLNNIQKEFDYDEAAWVADHDNNPYKGGVMPKEIYGKSVPVLFEECSFQGVQQPDEYLKRMYGDYMKLPDTLPLRNFRYMDLNQPYATYLSQKRNIP